MAVESEQVTRTEADQRRSLEYKLLFAITVAGKSAKFAQAAMEQFGFELRRHSNAPLWLPAIRDTLAESARLNRPLLEDRIRAARMGNYAKLTAAFEDVASIALNLATITIDQLEAIRGVGPKTSRFFLRWSNRRERVAVLDVHILAWLAERGHNVPRSTPQDRKQYQRVETIFLNEADAIGVHPSDLDERIWLARNRSGIRQ